MWGYLLGALVGMSAILVCSFFTSNSTFLVSLMVSISVFIGFVSGIFVTIIHNPSEQKGT
jgi:hypothetical protein